MDQGWATFYGALAGSGVTAVGVIAWGVVQNCLDRKRRGREDKAIQYERKLQMYAETLDWFQHTTNIINTGKITEDKYEDMVFRSRNVRLMLAFLDAPKAVRDCGVNLGTLIADYRI